MRGLCNSGFVGPEFIKIKSNGEQGKAQIIMTGGAPSQTTCFLFDLFKHIYCLRGSIGKIIEWCCDSDLDHLIHLVAFERWRSRSKVLKSWLYFGVGDVSNEAKQLEGLPFHKTCFFCLRCPKNSFSRFRLWMRLGDLCWFPVVVLFWLTEKNHLGTIFMIVL